MIENLKSVIMGIIEGITEWLPISSTGHLILLNEFMSYDNSFLSSQLYLYVIQLGAILAVIVIYFKKLLIILLYIYYYYNKRYKVGIDFDVESIWFWPKHDENGMVINPSSIEPTTDGKMRLGTSDSRWHTVYAKNGVSTTSDRKQKENINLLNDKYIQLFKELKQFC